jgi:hypothetical protein
VPAEHRAEHVADPRPAHGEDQHDDHERAQGEQEPLLELQPAAIGAQRELEVLHRRPVDDLEPPAVEQVDDQRDRGESESAEEEGVQEHPHPSPWGIGSKHE